MGSTKTKIKIRGFPKRSKSRMISGHQTKGNTGTISLGPELYRTRNGDSC